MFFVALLLAGFCAAVALAGEDVWRTLLAMVWVMMAGMAIILPIIELLR